MKIKLVGFDLWQTLITTRKDSNSIRTTRIDLIYNKYNPKAYSIDRIKQICENIKEDADLSMEVTGFGIPPDVYFYLLLRDLGYGEVLTGGRIASDLVQSLKKDAQLLIQLYPPVAYSQETVDVIHELHERKVSMCILSNTNFILGSTLSPIIDSIFGDVFQFKIFSDEGLYSKPNPLFFNQVIEGYDKTEPLKSGYYKDIHRQDILHVGDNIECDFKGANDSGFQTILINNSLTENTIKDVFKFDIANG